MFNVGCSPEAQRDFVPRNLVYLKPCGERFTAESDRVIANEEDSANVERSFNQGVRLFRDQQHGTGFKVELSWDPTAGALRRCRAVRPARHEEQPEEQYKAHALDDASPRGCQPDRAEPAKHATQPSSPFRRAVREEYCG